MAGNLIIPMVVLAHHLKTSLQVPAINPNYKTALRSYLGKDSTPAAFNTNLLLKKGVHLHFVLPSALKKGCEAENSRGERIFEYPAVPDRFLVTRMYVKNNQIETDCNIVESNFYSLDSSYSDSITIPKFDDLRARHRFRYMGRTYPAARPAPAPVGESGYFDKITAVGAGDPMFSAYYPSCASVFGFYDSLEGVPSDAVLTYFVVGYYSNPANDIFSHVKNTDDMQKTLEKYNLSADPAQVCSSCSLFGEAGGIDLASDSPVPIGEINIGIGKSSAEALSAIISGCYYKDRPDMERFLTAVQYDIADEAAQPDGNFKIDDDIHFQGFSRIDPIENLYNLKLPKNTEAGTFDGFAGQYSDLMLLERLAGKNRRLLEYKKNSLYYLWEIYEGAGSEKKKQLKQYLDLLLDEINRLRQDISLQLHSLEKQKNDFEKALRARGGELDAASSEPFYLPKDPAVMLFGEGMNRTYAFGEDGRFESDNTLFCLTETLTADISSDTVSSYFHNLCSIPMACGSYKAYAVSAVLLDTVNILPRLKLNPVIQEKYSPVLFNASPDEQVTLLMQWESIFYPDYNDSDPKDSIFAYGDTDYTYQGAMSEHGVSCSGVTVLTPHGVYNLEDKLKKYLVYHSDSPDAGSAAEKIKDLAAVSQNLGGFDLNLAALTYAFQYPITIDPQDDYAKTIASCIEPENPAFYEPSPERPAVQNNTPVFPLREGFFRLSKLALTTSFGLQRKIIDDDLAFKGTRYVSENLKPVNDDLCFFPLTLTSPARLSTYFVTADDNKRITSPFLDASPVIGIILPDMLNRNLNLFTNTGVSIGILKTVYRTVNGRKTAAGRFVKSPDAPLDIDERINHFIAALTQDNTAFVEVMQAIDEKLNVTLPLAQNHFIFGRALVLAEIAMELEFFGAPEWSKKDADIGSFSDLGLSGQSFPVYFGDKNRASDGVCCGFLDDFSKGFPAFGAKKSDADYLSADALPIKSSDGIKHTALLFDPMLKVTINTGFLPVQQLELFGEHTDFSKFQLLTSELHTIISGEQEAELPDFTNGADFHRLYPRPAGGHVTYEKLAVVKPSGAINIERKEKTMITDGLILEIERSDHNQHTDTALWN